MPDKEKIMQKKFNPIYQGNMPKIIRELIGKIGLTKAMALVGCCGGTRVHIPKTISDKHWLSELLGYEALNILHSLYAGTNLNVPLFSEKFKWERKQRNYEIIRRYENGENIRKLCRDFGLHERRIWQILKMDL